MYHFLLILFLFLIYIFKRNIFKILINRSLYNYMGVKGIIEDKLNMKSNVKQKYNGNGEIVVITGGARGIGFEVVKAFLEMNLTVIIGCRNVPEGEKSVYSLRNSGITTGKIECLQLDISCMRSIKNFVENLKNKYQCIHILVNNAGILYSPFKLTEDGFEYILATNYLGHCLLTHLLLPYLIKGAQNRNINSRIINVSSIIYEMACINFKDINFSEMYSALDAYSQSKLAQLLFTKALNEKLISKNLPVQSHAVHPGIVNSNLFEKTFLKPSWFTKILFKTPEEGARTLIYASLNESLENKGGNYISNCRIIKTTKAANNEDQEQLWNLNLKLLNIHSFGNVL